jgi:hypothetical protein
VHNYNLLAIELLAQDRMKDALRQAEQAQLIRILSGPKKRRGWRMTRAPLLEGLLSLGIRLKGLRTKTTPSRPLAVEAETDSAYQLSCRRSSCVTSSPTYKTCSGR